MSTEGLSQSQEDYLEAIFDLISDKGTATVSDMAERLGVAKPSVVKALTRLCELKLATHERYGDVGLTEVGRNIAETVRLRHNTLVSFLTDFLGVDEGTADGDACALEHNLSGRTTERLVAFINLNRDAAVRVVKGKNFKRGD